MQTRIIALLFLITWVCQTEIKIVLGTSQARAQEPAPSPLSLPTRIDVPEFARGTTRQWKYELLYLASWNETLRRLGNSDFNSTDIIFVLNKEHEKLNLTDPKDLDYRAAFQGMEDGRGECCKAFTSVTQRHGNNVAREEASKSYTKIDALKNLIADSLFPPTVEVPKRLDSFVLRVVASGESEFLMPRAHFIAEFNLNWNEALYNFGVLRLPTDQIDRPVVVGVSRIFHPQIEYGDHALHQCAARIRLLSKIIPEDELRRAAANSIPHETKECLDKFPLVTDEDE
jgi:hypothetical protein